LPITLLDLFAKCRFHLRYDKRIVITHLVQKIPSVSCKQPSSHSGPNIPAQQKIWIITKRKCTESTVHLHGYIEKLLAPTQKRFVQMHLKCIISFQMVCIRKQISHIKIYSYVYSHFMTLPNKKDLSVHINNWIISFKIIRIKPKPSHVR
jgi:hypothetical protein